MKLLTSKLIALTIALTVGLCTGRSGSASTIVFNNISPTTPYYSNFGSWLGTFGQQLRKYGRDIRANVGGRLRGDGSRRDLGYPGRQDKAS